MYVSTRLPWCCMQIGRSAWSPAPSTIRYLVLIVYADTGGNGGMRKSAVGAVLLPGTATCLEDPNLIPGTPLDTPGPWLSAPSSPQDDTISFTDPSGITVRMDIAISITAARAFCAITWQMQQPDQTYPAYPAIAHNKAIYRIYNADGANPRIPLLAGPASWRISDVHE